MVLGELYYTWKKIHIMKEAMVLERGGDTVAKVWLDLCEGVT